MQGGRLPHPANQCQRQASSAEHPSPSRLITSCHRETGRCTLCFRIRLRLQAAVLQAPCSISRSSSPGPQEQQPAMKRRAPCRERGGGECRQ